MKDERLRGLLVLDIDGVLTDGKVTFDASGRESKTLSYRDIDAVFSARRMGLTVATATSEDTDLARFIVRRLGIENALFGLQDKVEGVERLRRDCGFELELVCFVGDGDRDARALRHVALGLAPANATEMARDAASLVLSAKGGCGAVDEAVRVFREYLRRAGA